jgi:Trk K+ transport system NAD-binding subunit/Kef-type K+ transport system membrane component KefB
MSLDINILLPLATFVIIAFASESISKFFAKIHLPLISGLIFTGIIVGPYILKIISDDSLSHVSFLLDVALAFIAMAAGNELHIKELGSRLKSIKINTFFQIVFTFLISTLGIYFLSDYIPFLKEMPSDVKMAIAALLGIIFIARSPSSAIAIIREVRGKGAFVSTSIGVIVLIDVVVVILFAVTFSVTDSIINKIPLDLLHILYIALELVAAVILAYLMAKVIELIFSIRFPKFIKTLLLLSLGYSLFPISDYILLWSEHYLGIEFFVEPILVALLASFYITNYTKHKLEFGSLLHNNGSWIYVVFFTLTGASLSIDLFLKVWQIALVLFGVRIIGLAIGGLIGGFVAKNPLRHIKYAWLPYVTQAGIGIGLATEISEKFPTWGHDAFTVIIAVIVLSQIVGPPLFKYAISKVGEAHLKAPDHEFDGIKDLLIFGYENQSQAIAVNLIAKGWNVKIATFLPEHEVEKIEGVEIVNINTINLTTLKKLKAENIEAALLLLSDKDNLKIAEILYEHFGTKEVIVRINDRKYYTEFKELNCYVVDPSNAMINLLMQYIKSPHSATLLLGELKGQSSLDIEVRDKSVIGKYLRELHLPSDIIVLSIKRKGQIIVTHGYTKLEFGDIMTVIGNEESLEMLNIKYSVIVEG